MIGNNKQPPAPLKIVHALASIDDPAAGPSQSVPALASSLALTGAEVTVHALQGWRTTGSDSTSVPGVHVERHALDLGPFGRLFAASASMRAAILRAAACSDIVHTHGLWLAPNFYPAAAIKHQAARAKMVLSPRGMLGVEALAISNRRKRLVWMLAQRDAAVRAHCLHATAESELAEIRALGLRNPVAVIPNGIELPPLRPQTMRAERERVVLSLGRLHAKKGLDRLITGWARIERDFPEWRLRIVGRSEQSHADQLKTQVRKLKLQRVSVEGPLYGRDKAKAYWSSDVFVLPSLNENFAMTVAEALAHGVPVISSQGAPWSGLVREGCGWWVHASPDSLAEALAGAMRLDDSQRLMMGELGRAWMARDFSWDSVAKRMTDVYCWLARGGACPSTVFP
ncbi:MAG: glycosyltransferase [Hyphomonadaceae bacterium]|nr:glycosyltransferase [Hyphomonadaceae bacterium]MBY0565140.1 glycosyltransferase [Hyphomonadaceae bacterium]